MTKLIDYINEFYIFCHENLSISTSTKCKSFFVYFSSFIRKSNLDWNYLMIIYISRNVQIFDWHKSMLSNTKWSMRKMIHRTYVKYFEYFNILKSIMTELIDEILRGKFWNSYPFLRIVIWNAISFQNSNHLNNTYRMI